MKKIPVLIIIAMLFVAGCGPQIAGGPSTPIISPEQEDAGLRLTGFALGKALILAKPELYGPAKEYCQVFMAAEDLIEAKTLLETALRYLAGKYTGDSSLGKAMSDAITLMGFDEKITHEMISGEFKKLDKITQEILHKARMVLTGFCGTFI